MNEWISKQIEHNISTTHTLLCSFLCVCVCVGIFSKSFIFCFLLIYEMKNFLGINQSSTSRLYTNYNSN